MYFGFPQEINNDNDSKNNVNKTKAIFNNNRILKVID